MKTIFTILFFLSLSLINVTSNADTGYFIGNSLTTGSGWFHLDNGREPRLTNVAGHLHGGASLIKIYNEPLGVAAYPWTEALYEQQWDILSVQPFKEDNLTTTIDIIEEWANLQPNAIIQIHSGWWTIDKIEEEWNSTDLSQVHASPLFWNAFLKALEEKLPSREILFNPSYELVHQMANDKRRPFSMEELYVASDTDRIHLDSPIGSYFAHNLMRQTLGLSWPYVTPFDGIQPLHRKYIDRLVIGTAVPEPSNLLLISFIGFIYFYYTFSQN